MTNKKLDKGLIQIYTGDGKGKTTAALGVALRAIGHGLRVYMIQFMKGDIDYGEIKAVKKLENFEIIQFGRPDFVNRENPENIDIKLANEALAHAREVMRKREYDILILDEINVAVNFGLIEVQDVLNILNSKPENMELILTGRYAPPEILEKSDLITEMKCIKHPHDKGVVAREGIEH